MKLARTLLAAAAATSVVLVAACGAVGDGILPESAAIRLGSGGDDITTAKTYVCVPQALAFVLTFSNGERADYAAQARWTSSNSSVAQVSNRDIVVPDGTGANRYASGVVISGVPGTATITGEYLSFKKSVEVSVDRIGNLRTTPTELNLAPGSIGDLTLLGDLSGVATNLDGGATWTFVTPNTATATIAAASGTVSAVAAGDTLTARASLAGCDTVADAPVSVSTLQSIAVTQEFAGNPNLVVGTSELLTAIATLANGKTQDLTTQATYSSTDSTLIAPLLVNPGYVVALKANATAVPVTASFGTSPAVVSNAVNLTPIDATLSKVSISPASLNLAPSGFASFTAMGEYTSGATQPITRHVNFTSSNTAVVTVGTNSVLVGSTSTALNVFAGLTVASSAATAGQTATVTASNPAATTQPLATATVTIVAP